MMLSKSLLASCFILAFVSAARTESIADSMVIVDVAVIGAGPGGLATALALSKDEDKKNSISSIAIFEKAREFRPIGAALGLNTVGYEALSSLRPTLADLVRSKAANPRWHLLQRPNGEILVDDESIMHDTDFTWLGWFTLQEALKESLPENVVIHLKHRLVAIEQLEDSVKLHFSVRDQEGNELPDKIVHARILIGADGYNSVVRHNSVSDGNPTYTGTMTWRGVIDKSHFDASAFGAPFHSTDENGNISIIGDNKNFWIMDCGNGQIAWTATAKQEKAEKSLSARDTAMTVFEGWPEIAIAVMNATDPKAIVESGIFDRDPVDSWGVSNGGKYQRITLLGDAAHPMRPSLGLGSTNAFQDALSLGSKLEGVDLLDTGSVASALKLYEEERIAATSPLQIQARKMGEATHDKDYAESFKKAMESALAAKRQSALETEKEL